MKNLGKKQKIILAVLLLSIIFVSTLLITKVSYSYMGADIDKKKVTEGEIGVFEDSLIFTKGNDLTLNPTTDNFNTLTNQNLTATTNPSVKLVPNIKTNSANDTYVAGIKINRNDFVYSTTTEEPEVILTIKDENNNLITTSADPGLTYNSTLGGFDITGITGMFNIVKNHPISANTSSGTTHTWTFTITLINLENDQSINENAKLEVDAILQKDELQTLAIHINGLYSEDGVNGLYLHDGIGENASHEALDNSIRYSGANSTVNNYVCFGSDETPCPSDNLYRIIGLFKDSNNVYQTKLIKASVSTQSITGNDGAYASYTFYNWNSLNATTRWQDSNLNNINLNTDYINYLNTQGTKWAKMIDNHEWQIGGRDWNKVAVMDGAEKIYTNELGTGKPAVGDNGCISTSGTTKTCEAGDLVYNAKIGLMYLSDYAYAATPASWDKRAYSGDASLTFASNKSNNWLYLGNNEWIITTRLSYPTFAYGIDSNGVLFNSTVNDTKYSVRPTFYLKSNVSYVSGTGTSSDPIIIG